MAMPTPLSEYQFFIGIDIAKDSFVVASSDIKEVKTFFNNLEGFKTFSKHYKDILDKAFITLETTGHYEYACLEFLVTKGCFVHRAHASQVKAFIKSLGQKVKTDHTDAKALVLYGEERHRRLDLFNLPSAKEKKLSDLIRRRDDLVQMQTQEKNRLKAPSNDYVKKGIERHRKFLEKEIQKTQDQIETLCWQDETFREKRKIAQGLPGIGKIASMILLINLPEIGFLDRRAIAALAGLAPLARDSGQYCGYRFTWKGREQSKKTLFLVALSAGRSKSVLGDYYRDLIKRGKKPMVALIALARKILVILNARIRDYYKEQAIQAKAA